MTSGFLTNSILGGLTFRVLLFLSLALLPLGSIALLQTQQIAAQSRTSAELSLIAMTEQKSAAERAVIQEAFGAEAALSSAVQLQSMNGPRCSAFLREYADASAIYSHVGFVNVNGRMTCTSSEKEFDFSDNEYFLKNLDNPRRLIGVNGRGVISGVPVIYLNSPVFDENGYAGYMTASIPLDRFANIPEPNLPANLLAMVTFNAKGDIITTENDYEKAIDEMPAGFNLKSFVGEAAQVFQHDNKGGAMRHYAVLPIVPGVVYAMTVWPYDTPLLRTDFLTRVNGLLPVIMWLASLVVAFWALNRLAISHIRKLSRQMRHFAVNRTLPKDPLRGGMPVEIVEIEQAFIGMADSILRDEAAIEDSLREKNILLKEVHHRVKNNLQLISSIMNMQIRQAPTASNKAVLQRLQDRILSLAKVHESLYRGDELTRVDGGALLSSLADQLFSMGLPAGIKVKVTQSIVPMTLDADDAAPFTLLATEALTNALKYVGSPVDGGTAMIDLRLEYAGDENGMLTLVNSVGAARPVNEDEVSGLGAKLIAAFARQLNAVLTVTEEEGAYRLCLEFPVPQHAKPVTDY